MLHYYKHRYNLNTTYSTNFPSILILDEPKQQNLDNKSLIDSLQIINDIKERNIK